MDKLGKRLAAVILSVLLVVAVLPLNVYADTYTYLKAPSDEALKGQGVEVIDNGDGSYTLKLTRETHLDFEIASGQKIILDLNNQTLTNYSTQTEGTSCVVFNVLEGGQLTIKGNGTVKQKDNTSEKIPLIENKGTLRIEGGNFEQGKAYGAVISREGSNTTISGGRFTQNADSKWSIVDNKGNMSITGGTLTGTANFWTVRNEGSLSISGGTITAASAGVVGTTTEGDAAPGTSASTTVTGGDFESTQNGGNIFVVYGDEEGKSVDLNIQKVEGASVTVNGALVGMGRTGNETVPSVKVAAQAAQAFAGSTSDGTVVNSSVYDDTVTQAVIDGAYVAGEVADVNQAVRNAASGQSVVVEKAPAETNFDVPTGVGFQNNTGSNIKANGEEVQGGGKYYKPLPTPAPAPLPADFAGIAAQNSDMYGWIVLPGTALDDPVFSSPAGSDDFYLDHAADKSYDPYGCVFSQGAYNAAGFTDRVTVLYGHDVYTTDTGFHPLHHFEEDAAFCAEHREVLTYTADSCQHWRVLGVCNTDDAHILYANGSFEQLSVLQSWLERFTPTSDAADPALAAPQESDRYLVLSTCNQIAQNQRYLTVCVLERTEPAA